MLTAAPHPLLEAIAFETRFPSPLSEVTVPADVTGLLRLDAAAPLTSDDATRAAIRDLLRRGGYKPTGRGKPASEYLLRAAGEGSVSSINAAVDACNAVSLHSGLPISVVDVDRAKPPFDIRIPRAGDPTAYVFNASGQSIDVAGLVCLFDAEGPCANAVKDAQRTKTHAGTTHTLTVIWSAKDTADRAERAFGWYAELLARMGAVVIRTDVARDDGAAP
jgi:DNA/RNA-binding domain of Phe-tRNA-synthetase-like protein